MEKKFFMSTLNYVPDRKFKIIDVITFSDRTQLGLFLLNNYKDTSFCEKIVNDINVFFEKNDSDALIDIHELFPQNYKENAHYSSKDIEVKIRIFIGTLIKFIN